jgi:putative addiction module component (TIGR02574 family)
MKPGCHAGDPQENFRASARSNSSCQTFWKEETPSMTIAVLEKEVMALPPASRVRFVEKVLASVDDFVTPGIEKAWQKELERRAVEIRAGRAKGIPAGKVMAQARRKVNEARRLSSAGRK